MRSKKALYNTISAITYELVVVICGLILPRLILSTFGSAYNGITSSITQFLSCVTLLRAGVAGVTRAALYKPLADSDTGSISAIVNATQAFMKKIALIFVAMIFVFAVLYPYLVSDEFEWLFSFSLVLILGISTFMQYYFGLTYQILIQSDQRDYIVSSIQIVTTILNTVIAAILIKCGSSIHIVKLGSALVFSINPLLFNFYAHKKYGLDKKCEPDNNAIKQRWDAFGQSFAFFIHNNTAIILLTAFTNVREVSVYTVYNYVIGNIRTVLLTFVNGFGAAFGNMLANKEYKLIQQNLKLYELIVFFMAAVIYSTAGNLIVPFALVYTKGVTDVEYARYTFAFLITVAGSFSCFRIPYQTITEAAGHFKQTRNGAFVEAGLNIVISIVAVHYLGLVGVALGMLVATIFRSFQYAIYLSKKIVPRSIGIFLGHLAVNLIIASLTTYVSLKFFNFNPSDWGEWFKMAFCVGPTAAGFSLLFHFVFYGKEMCLLIKKVKALFMKKVVKNG